ncbi:MAG: AmmeMemoRadiSam system protein B [Magnetococcales bacterium]|nr:AmmeMemoRadiSam system protein B [Magnetococcales bacterium]
MKNGRILWVGLWLVVVLASGLAHAGQTDEKRIRPAAVAGSWYPGEAAALRGDLEQAFSKLPPPSEVAGAPVRALLAPHAGYRFSGATAAAAFRMVAGKSFKRVVVLGPSHQGAFQGLALPEVTHYQTPLGEIPLDDEALKGLATSGIASRIPGVDAKEHAIEMQLPWLQQALQPGWKLVPLLVGGVDPALSRKAARALRPWLDEQTLLVVSGDFTHFGPAYDYLPFPVDGETEGKIRALDMGAWERVQARDAAGLYAHRTKTGITACAFGPLTILIHLMTPETVANLEAHATSGSLPENSNSVSYLAASFRDPAPLSKGGDPVDDAAPDVRELSGEELRLLHRLAVRTVRLAVEKGVESIDVDRLLDGVVLTESLKQPRGVFVTLNTMPEERLRGCIGHIEPLLPLYEAVIDNGVNAALRDRRFRPVTRTELAGLELEVSVLTPLRPIAAVEAFEVGKHGIVMSKAGRRAVFLPNVATEQGWSREETLTHLSLKAALPADGWKTDARFEVFTTQRFTAPLGSEK